MAAVCLLLASTPNSACIMPLAFAHIGNVSVSGMRGGTFSVEQLFGRLTKPRSCSLHHGQQYNSHTSNKTREVYAFCVVGVPLSWYSKSVALVSPDFVAFCTILCVWRQVCFPPLYGPWKHVTPHGWKTTTATNLAAAQDDGGMRLTYVHCLVRSTPPQFVAHVLKIIVQSILGGQNCSSGTIHVTCFEQVDFIDLVLCFVLCRDGFGVDCGMLGGFSRGGRIWD